MSLTLHGSWLLFVALALSAIVIALFYYRRTSPPVHRGTKATLVSLRALAILLLLLALFEPLLHRVFTSIHSPRVVVLIDNSRSMSVTDAREDRRASMQHVIDNVIGSSQHNAIDGVLFADTVEAVTVDSLRRFNAGGMATDISAALRAAVKDRDAENIQAVVLVSDGRFTAGSDPRSFAADLPLPIYTIGIGDSSDPKDVSISSVIANSSVLLGNSLPVDVQIHSTGFDGQMVSVTMSDESAVVGTQKLLLKNAVHDYTLAFVSTPVTAGLHKFRVAVTPLAGEQTDRNNSHAFFVRVIDSKITVALFAGAPGPDVSFVRQALSANPHITVLPFIQNSEGGFYPVANRGPATDATCIVMVDFPTRATTAQTVNTITDILQRKNAPLLFVWGNAVDPQVAQRFDAWLPFTFSATRAGEQTMSIVVPPDALADPVMRVLGDVHDSAAWHSLPPTTYLESGFKAKAGSVSLATMKLFNTVTHQPVILSQHLNRLRSIAVLTAGTWKWRLLGKGIADATNSATPDVYTYFMSNAVQWLTSADADKPVRIQPVKSVFTPVEEIDIAGEVMDEKFSPVDDATVEATVTGASGTFNITLAPRGNGRYYGAVSKLPEGDYTVNGTARISSKALGTDNAKFTVADMGAEFQDLRMDAQLMRALAAQTGGQFATSQDAARLLDSVFANPRVAPATVVNTSEIELWTNVWLLAAALAAFCVEWFIRKQKGLL